MEEQTIKIFTVEEANNVLPYISGHLSDAQELSNRARSIKIDIEGLVGIWGKDVLERGHVDNEYYNDRVAQRQKTQSGLAAKIEEIQKFGCIVKDVDAGLIDFYCDNNGTLVFLCWKHGEKKVDHWHAINGGFNVREHIGSMK